MDSLSEQEAQIVLHADLVTAMRLSGGGTHHQAEYPYRAVHRSDCRHT
jgi:hypothetical protein